MKTLALTFLVALIFLVAFTSCAPQAFPVGTPNPLDTPGDEFEGSIASLHADNIRAITR